MNKLLQAAQAAAPSWLGIIPDGAPMVCDECGKRDNEKFIRTFTPDGKHHYACHLDCVDQEWLAAARFMGDI